MHNVPYSFRVGGQVETFARQSSALRHVCIPLLVVERALLFSLESLVALARHAAHLHCM